MSEPTLVTLYPMQQEVSPEETSLDVIVNYLDECIADVFQNVTAQEYFQVLSDPDVSPELVRLFLREVNLEIFSYQPHFTEATIAAIAQMPRSIAETTLKKMLTHQAEEFSHSEKALRGYIALGGEETIARNRRISPASFAVAGFWWMVVQIRDPFMYLGALYLFERIAPTVTSMVQQIFSQAGVSDEAMEFINSNANEDIRHSNLMRELLSELVEQYPQAASSIRYGMECCRPLYPLPIWETAYRRAKAQFKG